MLRVTSKAGTQNLITVDEVRTRLLDGDSSEDALLKTLITAASSAMAAHVGFDMARQSYKEVLPGTGRRRLTLARAPVDPDSVVVTIDDEVQATTEWSVEDQDVGILYRRDGWTRRYPEIGGGSEEYIEIAYTAGWVLPDMVRTWADDLTLAAGEWIRPTSASLTPLLMEVTTSGAVSGSEPTWPTTSGETLTSGAAELTARYAEELPTWVVDLAYLEVYSLYGRGERDPWLSQMQADGVQESYATYLAQGEDLYPAVKAGLNRIALPRVA